MEKATNKHRILYISSFSVGTLHGMINCALLEMLICLGYNIECFIPKSSEKTFHSMIDNKSINRWHHIFVKNGSGRISMLLRYILSAFHNIQILLKSKPNDIIFYNFNNVFSLAIIDLINKIKKRNIIICCHGEMEYLANADKHSAIYKRLMISLTCNYFNKKRKPAPGLRFIVFGDNIKTNLKTYLSAELSERFSSLDHPVATDQNRSDITPIKQNGRIDIGMIGIINDYKGCSNFPALALSLSKHQELHFHAIGHFQCNTAPFTNAGIEIPTNTSTPLSNEEFRNKVEQLDFLLFLYPTDTYRLIASGAVLDALRFRRPIIALKNNYFEYLFQKFGVFGYLANDIAELQNLLRKASSLSRDFPFDKIAQQLATQTLTSRLKEIISD